LGVAGAVAAVVAGGFTACDGPGACGGGVGGA